MSSKKTWVSIAIAAAIIFAIAGLSLLGGTAYYVYRHVHTEATTPSDATVQFLAARERFRGQRPLIDVRDDDLPVVNRPAASAPVQRLSAVHALVYDPDERKLVRFEIPMWLLRLSPGKGRVRIGDAGFDSDTLNVTLDDLERHGPGLILDRHSSTGSRVLVWAE